MTKRPAVLATFSFFAGAVLSGWIVPALRAQTARTMQTTNLMRFDLGSWCQGKELLIKLEEAGPGTSGKHYHPAQSFNWVVQGSEVHTVQGKPPITVKAGDILHDGPGEVHETQNTAPVKLLLFRIIEKGKPETTFVP